MDVKDVIEIWELIKSKTQHEGGYGNITYLDLENAIDNVVGVEGKVLFFKNAIFNKEMKCEGK